MDYPVGWSIPLNDWQLDCQRKVKVMIVITVTLFTGDISQDGNRTIKGETNFLWENTTMGTQMDSKTDSALVREY